jgi:hypothetical protein
LIKETEGREEFPCGTDSGESEVTEGFGSLAEVVELETGGSEEPFGPERAGSAQDR